MHRARSSCPAPDDPQGARLHACLEPCRRVGVAVDLGRAGGRHLDPDLVARQPHRVAGRRRAVASRAIISSIIPRTPPMIPPRGRTNTWSRPSRGSSGRRGRRVPGSPRRSSRRARRRPRARCGRRRRRAPSPAAGGAGAAGWPRGSRPRSRTAASCSRSVAAMSWASKPGAAGDAELDRCWGPSGWRRRRWATSRTSPMSNGAAAPRSRAPRVAVVEGPRHADAVAYRLPVPHGRSPTSTPVPRARRRRRGASRRRPRQDHEGRPALDGRAGRRGDLGGIAGLETWVVVAAAAIAVACAVDDAGARASGADPRGERADDERGGAAAGHRQIIGPDHRGCQLWQGY